MNYSLSFMVIVSSLVMVPEISYGRGTGQKQLFSAISNANLPAIEKALTDGANINAQRRGETPLCRAVRKGTIPVINLLLSKGANPALPDMKGNTPLHMAVEQKKEECVKRLVLAKAPLNVVNGEGETPLYLALDAGAAFVEILLNNNADINKELAVHIKIPPLAYSLMEGKLDVAKLLLKRDTVNLEAIAHLIHEGGCLIPYGEQHAVTLGKLLDWAEKGQKFTPAQAKEIKDLMADCKKRQLLKSLPTPLSIKQRFIGATLLFTCFAALSYWLVSDDSTTQSTAQEDESKLLMVEA